MSLSHYERISEALDHLTDNLVPYVVDEIRSVYGDHWRSKVKESFRGGRDDNMQKGSEIRWDAHALLTVMWDQWNAVFRNRLGHAERSLVSELRDFRNQWAHQKQFEFDDTYRILDSVQRLLKVTVPEAAEEIGHEKLELMRDEFAEQDSIESRKNDFQKKKWINLGIYIVCCLVIIGTIFSFFGENGLIPSVFIVLAFAYFTYQLLKEQPLLVGPHECNKCRRIVYSEPCPYCEPALRA